MNGRLERVDGLLELYLSAEANYSEIERELQEERIRRMKQFGLDCLRVGGVLTALTVIIWGYAKGL